MSPRAFIVIIGFILLGVGVFLGFSSTSISESSGVADCGSVFSANEQVPTDFGAAFGLKVSDVPPKQQCADKLSGRQPAVWGFIGVGVLTVIGSAVISTRKREPKPATTTPW